MWLERINNRKRKNVYSINRKRGNKRKIIERRIQDSNSKTSAFGIKTENDNSQVTNNDSRIVSEERAKMVPELDYIPVEIIETVA